MRVTRSTKPGNFYQTVSENKKPYDTKSKNICEMNPEATHSGRVTRSMSKLWNSMNNFIIHESYRCMPLLGNEKENVPDWDVHVVHYTITFINK